MPVDLTEYRRRAKTARNVYEMGEECDNDSHLCTAIETLCDELEELRAQAAKRANECQRIYYNGSAQQDQICRLPRGHAPDPNRCEGEPDEDSEGGAGRG